MESGQDHTLPGLETVVDAFGGAKSKRETQIIATLGPASNTEDDIRALIEAGVNVFRLNFSHGTHEQHKALADLVRQVSADLGMPVKVLVDLSGPKLRIGDVQENDKGEDKVSLEAGCELHFSNGSTPFEAYKDDHGNVHAHVDHPDIINALEEGHSISLDDGKLQGRIIRTAPDHAVAEILNDGVLSSNKGFNIPETYLPTSPLTEKDRVDAVFALSEIKPDIMCLSFVQTHLDMIEFRDFVVDQDPEKMPELCAKIEGPTALHYSKLIIGQSDLVMIARGDLGAEINPEDWAVVQEELALLCQEAGVDAIVATQVMESMMDSARPLRPEMTDVATAVQQKASYIMFSGETAVGAYGVQVVELVHKAILAKEAALRQRISLSDRFSSFARPDIPGVDNVAPFPHVKS